MVYKGTYMGYVRHWESCRDSVFLCMYNDEIRFQYHDSNCINAIPITSRKTPELIRAFKECHKELQNAGLTARLLKLDNEVSKALIKVITDTGLQYQLVSPGDHRQNPAERAIQAFKSHFIATRSGTDSNFPQDC